MKLTVTRRRPRTGRIGTGMIAIAGAAAISLSLAGCAGASGPTGDATDEPAGAASELFDPSLHDLLPESIKDSGTISFAGVWETPPMLMVDASDPTKPDGIAPVLWDLFGEVLGLEVESQNIQWPAQLPAVQSGSVDALFAQVSITAEREESVVDLIPFQMKTYGMLVAAGNPQGIGAIADLCGLGIGVAIGSTVAALVQSISDSECVGKGKPAIEIAEYQGAAASNQAIRAGTVDAWMDILSNVQTTARADSDLFTAIEVPTTEAPAEYLGIAVSKSNPGLSEALAGAMRILIENGMFEDAFAQFDDFSGMTLDQVVINPLTGTPAGEVVTS